jgi:ribosomal-protein-alanine N-acetyltransferase
MLTFNLHPFPELSTERVLLKAITEDHAEGFYRLRTDDDVMRYVEVARPQSKEEARAVIADQYIPKWQNNTGITWALHLKDNNEYIGNIGLFRLDAEHHRAEIGYTMFPAHWGKGLMGECLRTVIHYGFEQLNLHSIEANINPENTASAKILERHGFVREAYFKENYYWQGKFLDSAIYSLLVQDWKKHNT